jgi:hypothetical protein
MVDGKWPEDFLTSRNYVLGSLVKILWHYLEISQIAAGVTWNHDKIDSNYLDIQNFHLLFIPPLTPVYLMASFPILILALLL